MLYVNREQRTYAIVDQQVSFQEFVSAVVIVCRPIANKCITI